eukprot:12460105-Alexandrium_andersonii.AAC.1
MRASSFQIPSSATRCHLCFYTGPHRAPGVIWWSERASKHARWPAKPAVEFKLRKKDCRLRRCAGPHRAPGAIRGQSKHARSHLRKHQRNSSESIPRQERREHPVHDPVPSSSARGAGGCGGC